MNDPRPIVIPFSDDSTLIFACRMRDVLRDADRDCAVEMTWFTDENALSDRQMQALLPEGPDRVADGGALRALLYDPSKRALITSRIYKPIGAELKKPAYRAVKERPCVIGFLGGLDFFPENGFMRRRNCDGVFLFPKPALDEFQSLRRAVEEPTKTCWQKVDFGHPAVLRPAPEAEEKAASRRDIYFFTQAISPLTKRSRKHVLEAIVAVARAHPERSVFIKLRHLPGENTNHLHKERYPYTDLLDTLGPLPGNLHVTDQDMETALKSAAIGITCTSTAALDVLRAGVSCMVYVDYVDHYRDRLAAPMRKLFSQSNLIVSLEQLLRLEVKEPDPAWLEEMFSPRDLGSRVLALIDEFESRSS